MKRKILLCTLALPVILLQNAQAQSTSRLIAESHWNSNGVVFSPNDSSDYSYSGSRSGSLDLAPTSIDVNNNNNNAPSLKYNTSTNWDFIGDSAYASMYSFQTFDGSNNVISSTTQNADGTPSNNTLYYYNASNMLVKVTYQSWGGSSWISYQQHLYSYYPSGKLSIDSVQSYQSLTSSWETTGMKTYFYDGMLNLVNETEDIWTGGSPVHSTQWIRTYSATNQLLTTTLSTWSGTGWENYYRYTHDYDTIGNPISLLLQYYNSSTPAWGNYELYLYSNFNSSNLAQTVVHQLWDNTGSGAWLNNMLYAYVYNTFNQVTLSSGISWNTTSNTYQYANGDPLNKYYYQTTVPTTVSTAGSNSGEVNIYPVPAQNMLHIDLNWNVAQSATISIMDMSGSVVRQWNVPSATQNSTAVSVNNLAAGMYVIKINGEKNQVVKQIVVAH